MDLFKEILDFFEQYSSFVARYGHILAIWAMIIISISFVIFKFLNDKSKNKIKQLEDMINNQKNIINKLEEDLKCQKECYDELETEAWMSSSDVEPCGISASIVSQTVKEKYENEEV